MLALMRPEGFLMLEYRKATGVITETGNDLVGIAVPWGEWAEIREGGLVFREQFAQDSVAVPESATLRYGHDPRAVPLARVGAGTIAFRNGEHGLMFDAKLPESAFSIREALKRGDLDGSVSIGFYAEKDIKKSTRGGKVAFTRTVTAASLDHLALVETPAYKNARAIFNES